MKLAKQFADIDSAEKEPADVIYRGYTPIGNMSGSGTVSVSAFEAMIPATEFLFRGIRFEVSSGDEYAPDGIVTIALENAEKLIASLQQLANTNIQTDRFALSELEAEVEGLRVTVFNTDRGQIMASINADGISCHLFKHTELLNLAKLVSLGVSHLKSL